MARLPVILCKDRTRRSDRSRLERRLVEELSQQPDVELRVLEHLYNLPADGPGMQCLRSIPGDIIVLAWLYPRAAFWVLDANQIKGRLGEADSAEPGEDGSERTLWCLDLRNHEQPEPYLDQIARIVERVAADAGEAVEAPAVPAEVDEATLSRWYPVVDYDRCTNCMECLNFCLFGVYGVDGSGAIMAEQPDACRAGCPACARICPAGAIMFPEHRDAAIAGDPAASPQALKLDLSQLFGGADPAQLAAAERDRALAEKARQEGETATADDDLDRLVDEVDELEL